MAEPINLDAIAVIPAAGNGSRLGLTCPKILAPVTSDVTIFDILMEKLAPKMRHIIIVISPWGQSMLRYAVDNSPLRDKISIVIQEKPIGMGDAVFCCANIWKTARNILVLWGDQVAISGKTLHKMLESHSLFPSPVLTMPFVAMENPYVEYVFDDQGAIKKIRQTREGDQCQPGGLGDMGAFLLSTRGLPLVWREYLTQCKPGVLTSEINFLPFLLFITSMKKWSMNRLILEDAREARGINTQADLAWFRELYAAGLNP